MIIIIFVLETRIWFEKIILFLVFDKKREECIRFYEKRAVLA